MNYNSQQILEMIEKTDKLSDSNPFKKQWLKFWEDKYNRMIKTMPPEQLTTSEQVNISLDNPIPLSPT